MENFGTPKKCHEEIISYPRIRFGKDNFQEAAKISNRVPVSEIDWDKFKYMAFDIPNDQGTYRDRYDKLGTQERVEEEKRRARTRRAAKERTKDTTERHLLCASLPQ